MVVVNLKLGINVFNSTPLTNMSEELTKEYLEYIDLRDNDDRDREYEKLGCDEQERQEEFIETFEAKVIFELEKLVNSRINQLEDLGIKIYIGDGEDIDYFDIKVV